MWVIKFVKLPVCKVLCQINEAWSCTTVTTWTITPINYYLWLCPRYKSVLKCAVTAKSKIFKQDKSSNDFLPSLLLTLAKTGPWLLDSWEELWKDDGGKLDTSGLSHTSVNQSQRKNDKDKGWVECTYSYVTVCRLTVALIWKLNEKKMITLH